MEWNDDHDVILCGEILVAKPYQFKARTVKKGGCRGNIADRLNECQIPKFKITECAVCDRCKILTDKYKKKMKQEEKAPGIEVDPQSELGQLLQSLIDEEEAMESAMEVGTAKRRKIEDKQKAEDIHMKAMEKMEKTGKRKEESAEGEGMPVKKSKREQRHYRVSSREIRARLCIKDFALKEKQLGLIDLMEQEQSWQIINQLVQQQSQMMAIMQQQQMKQQSNMKMALMKTFQ